jgi:hypothetical protein
VFPRTRFGGYKTPCFHRNNLHSIESCDQPFRRGRVEMVLSFVARRAFLLTAIAPITQRLPAHADGRSSYRLANGEVTVPDRPWECGGIQLVGEPSLVGSGSSSAVFGISSADGARVAVKIAWPGRASATVENEGKVLSALNRNSVQGVCKLRGACKLPGSDRVVLVLDPLVPAPTIDRIESLASVPLQFKAVEGLGIALVQILAASVATTDVQILVNGASGVPLLIDFSEARLLGTAPGGISDLDVALAVSFVSEVDALVPSQGALRRHFLTTVAATLRSPGLALKAELEEALIAQLGL